MILPHLLELEAYKKYFETVQGFKILDNGANEQISLPIEDLIILALQNKVNEIVIPDVMADRIQTQHKIEEFLLHPAAQLWTGSLMAVVQGKTWDDWYECIDFYLREPAITTIGLPRLIYKYAPNKDTRVFLANYIHNMGFNKPVHCLGATPWVEEVGGLAESGHVRGIDTSYPFVMAKALQRITMLFENEYVDRGDHNKFFMEVLNNEQYHFVEYNIYQYLRLAGMDV